jgi:hypothetical protein
MTASDDVLQVLPYQASPSFMKLDVSQNFVKPHEGPRRFEIHIYEPQLIACAYVTQAEAGA